jgi:hypothetical protein
MANAICDPTPIGSSRQHAIEAFVPAHCPVGMHSQMHSSHEAQQETDDRLV